MMSDGGDYASRAGLERGILVRLNPDGSVDSSFGDGGVATPGGNFGVECELGEPCASLLPTAIW
jgi:hypothetical protein